MKMKSFASMETVGYRVFLQSLQKLSLPEQGMQIHIL